MSPECDNCGATVSDRFVRVFSPDGQSVRACPRCEDMTRDKSGRPRPTKAPKTRGVAVSDGGAPQ